MIVHNFETTVTVPQHTVVVPKPACSYQNYTTFQRRFQVLSQFCVFGCFLHLCAFYAYTFFMWYRVHSSERPGPGAFALPRCAPQGGCDEGWMKGRWVYWWTELSDGLLLIFEEYFWSDWSCFDVLTDLITSYLWCSLLFICSVPTLPVLSPATSFTEISPDVILDYGIKKQVYHCLI